MSLIGSLLGLVLIPLKARTPEPPKELDNLAVMALADELRRLQFALDFWRRSGHALIAENEGLRAALFALRREKAQSAWNNRQQQQAITTQQIAAQNYDAAVQDWGGCTCVPSRSEALKR